MRVVGVLFACCCQQAASGAPLATEDNRPAHVVSEAERELAKVALEGLWSAVEEATSGIVRVEETYISGAEDYHEDHRYFVAFDCEKDVVRCDHDFDVFRDDQRVSGRRVQYARNAVESLLHIPSANHPTHMMRYPRDAKIKVHDGRPFDLRLIPIADRGAYRNRFAFAEYRKFYEKIASSDLIGCVRESDETIRLTWQYPLLNVDGAVMRRNLWLDPAIDYRPVRLEISGRSKDDPEWEPTAKTVTRWRTFSGTWVLEACTLSDTRAESPGRGSTELRFEWESLNEGVPEELLLIEGFGLPERTKVLNRKLGPIIFEGRIGDPAFPTDLGDWRPSSRLQWILGVNAALILAVGAPIVWRCRRRTRE